MSKASEIREVSDKELLSRLEESKQELFNLKFQLVTSQSDKSAQLRAVKREVARLNTLVREREIAAAEAAKRQG